MFATAKRFMTKEEIFHELESLKEDYMINLDKIVIIGDAAKILNDVEPNITYDTDTKPKNIDIWVKPWYYSYLLYNRGWMEYYDEKDCIYLPYIYTDEKGQFILRKGKYPCPKSNVINGYNVQLLDSDSGYNKKIVKFRRK